MSQRYADGKMSRRLLVNTDLDATLLDHDSYSWEPAREALDALREHTCPLVLNSSKTLAEMRELAKELQLNYPLVCENGAMIAFPKDGDDLEASRWSAVADLHDEGDYWVKYLGASRAKAVEVIHELRTQNAEFAFEGYSDWSAEKVAELTHLPIEKARLSKERLGTEPIIWSGSDEALQAFTAEVQAKGLQVLKGGRFLHVSGMGDKAQGLLELAYIYRELETDVQWVTVALGDSPNDERMLSVADIAVVIPNDTELRPTADQVIFAEDAGPTGWNKCMNLIINQQLTPY